MRRGTTPTVIFELDEDLSGWDIYLTFKYGGKKVTHKDCIVEPTADGCLCICELTQQETLDMKKGKGEVQIRAVNSEGVAAATDIFSYQVNDILLDGLIPKVVE